MRFAWSELSSTRLAAHTRTRSALLQATREEDYLISLMWLSLNVRARRLGQVHRRLALVYTERLSVLSIVQMQLCQILFSSAEAF